MVEESEPTTQPIKSSKNQPTASSTAGMKTNPAVTTTFIPICSTTCTPTPPADDGLGTDSSSRPHAFAFLTNASEGIVVSALCVYKSLTSSHF